MKTPDNGKMKVAIYARVSTKDKGQDTENQLRELRQFADSSGWEIVREYVDLVTGSGKRERVDFDQMMRDATRRKFKAVLVWALDRFTREGILATFDYVRKLTSNGVDFISYTEAHFRTTGPTGELMLAIAAWIAEQERKRIGERTRAGMETARRKGVTLGRPTKEIDIARIAELANAGNGPSKIARILSEGKPKKLRVSREIVRRTLRDRCEYAGVASASNLATSAATNAVESQVANT